MENLIYEKCFKDDEVDVWAYVKQGIKFFIYGVIILFLGCMMFGIRAYFVGGWSMQPTIDYMSLIVVNENVDKYNLKVGDIVTFKSGVVNTHRIIGVKYDENGKVTAYETKGDNPNTTQDPDLDPSKIIGTVVTIFDKPLTIPDLGYTIYDMQENKVLIVVYIIAMYLFFFVAPNPRKYVRYDAEE